jgi:hypothetical protein
MPVRVHLQFAKPTMRLARPISDGDGKLVAGVGTQLREGVVRVLRKMAVQSVLVAETAELRDWETIKPLADELRELDARFGDATDGARGELHAAIARHLRTRAERLAADPGLASGGTPDAEGTS